MLKRVWLIATLASLSLGAAADAQHGAGESHATWTFDTHTPGPCSPTGAAHGGCDRTDTFTWPSNATCKAARAARV